MSASVVRRLRRRLLAQADLFEDPRAYRAGVEDALRAIGELPEQHDELTVDLVHLDAPTSGALP